MWGMVDRRRWGESGSERLEGKEKKGIGIGEKRECVMGRNEETSNESALDRAHYVADYHLIFFFLSCRTNQPAPSIPLPSHPIEPMKHCLLSAPRPSIYSRNLAPSSIPPSSHPPYLSPNRNFPRQDPTRWAIVIDLRDTGRSHKNPHHNAPQSIF